ncbi:hypothetical protein [Yersinia frederiksenii]|uniref:hypothetical protein n=1 Tax=Yersinia frederiksenii TaxID=29484 RepID=UPI00067DC8E7|nr:hypothetical protein [Yersinia frederiksenii]ATM96137.1 hypothetical protein CRN75_12665 [Yersinia frederiksenii]
MTPFSLRNQPVYPEKEELAKVYLGVNGIYVLHQSTGHRYKIDEFNSRWLKAIKLAANTFPELDFNFTFYGLKAKGISDLEGSLGEKLAYFGHANIT